MTNFINRLRGGPGSGNEGIAAGAERPPKSALVPGKLIGAGGEGAVYEDKNDPRMVIKVLHQQQATAERVAKLRAMCQNPPQNADSLSWPNRLEGGVGDLRFRMSRAPSNSSTVYRFISANERRQLPRQKQEYEYRTALGVNIAEAFRWLHAIHVRIGDVNPSNILVADDGSVTVIDCDSFQIPGPHGHQPYPCTVGSPEYTAPEIDDFRRQFRSQDSDNFALAVLLYQLLGNGSHPYQGIDASATDAVSNIRERIKDHRFAHQPRDRRWKPTAGQILSWRAMPGPVQDAFRQTFSPGASHIGRPTADAWASILQQNPRPVPAGQQATTGKVTASAVAPPVWQVGPQSAATPASPAPSPSSLPKPTVPEKSISISKPPVYPAMERACPKCKSHDARLRRDWYKRYNAIRCRACNNVYGRTRIKRCPNCGSQQARLRSDWFSRGRPFRCTKCNVVFGGTDQVLPPEPVVGSTPNLRVF
jgi:serine/threonine protein kinase